MAAAGRRADRRRQRRGEVRRQRLPGGETQGNERLTVGTGLVLIVLLAAVGVTIVRIGQLLWLHLFLGLVVLGPVVFFTLAVFVTGVALLLLGPGSRDPLVLLHKVAFIAWVVFTALHVVAHLPEIARFVSGVRGTGHQVMALRLTRPAGRVVAQSSPGAVPGGVGRGVAVLLSSVGDWRSRWRCWASSRLGLID